MLALAHHRKLTCGGCGGWLPETTETDADEYHSPPPMRCGACTAISRAQDTYIEGYRNKGVHIQATRWRAELRSAIAAQRPDDHSDQ
jgi:hypothetical protein